MTLDGLPCLCLILFVAQACSQEVSESSGSPAVLVDSHPKGPHLSLPDLTNAVTGGLSYVSDQVVKAHLDAITASPPGPPVHNAVLKASASSDGQVSYHIKNVIDPYINASTISGPWYGRWWMAVLGSNFGTADYSPCARVGDSPCLVSQWVSDTSIYCQVPPGLGDTLPVLVLVGGQCGGLTACFTYNSSSACFASDESEPLWSKVTPAAIPTTGGALITIEGVNFGVFDT